MAVRRLACFCAVLLVCAACANSKSEAKPATPPPPPPKSDPPPSGKPPGSDGGVPAHKPDPSELPGVDVSGLDPSQVQALNQLLDSKASACGKGHSLRTSLKNDASCKRSVFAARYLVRLLKAGYLGSETEEIYDKRFTTPEAGKCEMKDAWVRGNVHAPIVVCEFSDFQCPHCKLMEPMLTRILEDYSGQVKLVYKNYPISKLHPEAREAAAAAVAAGLQGKFWQMHDKLFANQDHMSPVDLERYARELKLDVKKWKADLPAAAERVEKEHAEGEKLELTGTPTFYINGRKYAGPPRYDELRDWIDEELAK